MRGKKGAEMVVGFTLACLLLAYREEGRGEKRTKLSGGCGCREPWRRGDAVVVVMMYSVWVQESRNSGGLEVHRGLDLVQMQSASSLLLPLVCRPVASKLHIIKLPRGPISPLTPEQTKASR